MVAPQEPYRREEELPDYAKVSRRKAQKGLSFAMHPAFAVFLAFAVFVTLGFCVKMLSMQAMVAEQSTEITALQSRLEALTDDNNAYEARINGSLNLESIRERALAMGMVYPSEGQVLYYELSEDDYVRQYASVPGVE